MGWCRGAESPNHTSVPVEDATMTDFEIWGLAAPVVFTFFGWLYALWLTRR
jgi:hypothetical protein